MTQYSRTVIPGRTRSAAAGDLDPRMFGPGGDVPEAAPSDVKVRARGEQRDEEEFSRLPGSERAELEDSDSMRGRILLIGAAVVVAAFAFVLWNAYSQGLRGPEDDAAPMLVASGPFKSGASEATDEEADGSASRDAEVFSRLESPAAREVAKEPELAGGGAVPREAAPLSSLDTPAFVAPSVPPIRTVEAPKPPTTQTAGVKPASAPAIEPVPVTNSPAAEPGAESPISLVPKSVNVPASPTAAKASPPQQSAPGPVAAPKAASRAFASNGRFVVQLAAPATEAAAEAEWARRAAAAKDLFDGAEKLIVRADVNGKTVWRVRVGSFGTAEEADAFCAALKGKSGDCFRAAR